MYQFLINNIEAFDWFTFLNGLTRKFSTVVDGNLNEKITELSRGGDRIALFYHDDYIVVLSEEDIDEGNLLLDELLEQALVARMGVRLLHLSNFRPFEPK